MKFIIVLSAAAAGAFGQLFGGVDRFVQDNIPPAPSLPLPDVKVDVLGNTFDLKEIAEEFTNFKSLYNKTYKTLEEEKLRTEIFIENRKQVLDFNALYSLGKKTFVQQLNIFSDLLTHEFNQLFNGFNRHPEKRAGIRLPAATTYIPSANARIPERVDWRELGAVTPVKYQDGCAGCYAFSTTGALEGQWFRKTGKLLNLSPQNILDCSQTLGNDGCDGGFIDTSFEYVRGNPGLDTEASYPYEGQHKDCRFKKEYSEVNVTGFADIPSGDEKALKYAVATVGPVSAAIDASGDGFKGYRDGVYFNPKCGNTVDKLNHAILIIGYGIEPTGLKYWLIKNSYSTKWGNGGYMKLARDKGNHCGIATHAFYPLV